MNVQAPFCLSLFKLNFIDKKMLALRNPCTNVPKQCSDINLEKNVLKPFSTVDICFNRCEIKSKYRINNENMA